ncbi:MAG: hypothetical protein ACJAWC_003066 [Yoonia sp.]|jgi:hypothetical protein
MPEVAQNQQHFAARSDGPIKLWFQPVAETL